MYIYFFKSPIELNSLRNFNDGGSNNGNYHFILNFNEEGKNKDN